LANTLVTNGQSLIAPLGEKVTSTYTQSGKILDATAVKPAV
jgi:hypothetical protein